MYPNRSGVTNHLPGSIILAHHDPSARKGFTLMTQPPQPPPGYQQPYPVPPGGAQQPPKKRKKWPWILGALVVIVIIAAVAGGGGDDDTGRVISTSGGAPTAQDAPENDVPNPIGSTIEIEDSGARFTVTVDNLTPATPSEFAMPNQGELYQVTVTIQGIEGTANVNPLYVTARAADGTNYPAALGTVDDQLAATTVPAGDVIRGTVAFDVTGPPIASVRYEGALGQQRASWVVQ